MMAEIHGVVKNSATLFEQSIRAIETNTKVDTGERRLKLFYKNNSICFAETIGRKFFQKIDDTTTANYEVN